MIDKEIWVVLKDLEESRCTNPEAALSAWISLPKEVDGRSIIALLNQILDPITGKEEGLLITNKLTHVALMALVENSPLRELVIRDIGRNRLMINGNLDEMDLARIRELIRVTGVAFH